jgi:hypothetical protein
MGAAVNSGLRTSIGKLRLHSDAQRLWPRFHRRLLLEYRVDNVHWTRGWREGFTTNAGPMGLCVSSSVLPAEGSKVQVRLEVPGAGTLEMWGRVVWYERATALANRAPTSFGVSFLTAPEAWFQFCLREIN